MRTTSKYGKSLYSKRLDQNRKKPPTPPCSIAFGFKFWAEFTEKYGSPWAVGTLPGGASDGERADLMEAITDMVRSGAAVIPDTGSIEIKSDASRASSADVFERFVQTANAEISKAVLSQTLTTEVGPAGGSYAASKTHGDVRADVVESDRKMVSQAVGQLLMWFRDLNYARAAVPEFYFYEECDPKRELADRDEVLYRQGVRFTKTYYSETYDLDEGHFELATEAAAQEQGPDTDPAPPGEQPQPGEDGPGQTGGADVAAPDGQEPEGEVENADIGTACEAAFQGGRPCKPGPHAVATLEGCATEARATAMQRQEALVRFAVEAAGRAELEMAEEENGRLRSDLTAKGRQMGDLRVSRAKAGAAWHRHPADALPEAQFASGGDGAHRAAVDGLAEAGIKKADQSLADFQAKVQETLDRAETFEGFVDALYRSFAALDVGGLAVALRSAAFKAGYLGRGSVRAAGVPAGDAQAEARATGMRQQDAAATAFADGGAAWADMPMEEAVKYFRAKGMRITGNWREMWREAHAKAFTVAHCYRMDVLADVRSEVDKAISEGSTFREFSQALTPKLQAKGWWGPKEEGRDRSGGGIVDPDAPGPVYMAGSPYRLKTIFDTNLAVAYSTGRYRQLRERVDSAPLWQYSTAKDDRVRDEHEALEGKVFRADDPVWDTIYPPNGWNCRCTVVPLSYGQARDMGLEVEQGTEELEDGRRVPLPEYMTAVPPEWAYNPGKSEGWDTDGHMDDCEGAEFAEGPGKTCIPPVTGQKTWKDFGRSDIRDIPYELRTDAPAMLSKEHTQEAALSVIEKALGVSKEEPIRTVRTPVSDVIIYKPRLYHLVQKIDAGDHRERFANFIIPTLEDPFEVWSTAYMDGFDRLRYIGLFRDMRNVLVVVRVNRDGSLWWNTIPSLNAKNMNRNREGQLMYFKERG